MNIEQMKEGSAEWKMLTAFECATRWPSVDGVFLVAFSGKEVTHSAHSLTLPQLEELQDAILDLIEEQL